MRIRQRSKLKSNPAICTYSYELAACPGGQMTAPSNRVGPPLGSEEIMIDTVTPSWFQRIRNRAKGESYEKNSYVVNPMQRTRYTAISQGTGIETALKTPTPCLNGQTPNFNRSVLKGDAFSRELFMFCAEKDGSRISAPRPIIKQDEVDVLISKACTDAMAGVRAGYAGCLEDLGELHTTYSMLRHPLQSTAEFFSKLAKLKWSRWNPSKIAWRAYFRTSWHGARALFQYGSTQWLTYRYGVRPLMSSMSALVTAITTKKRSPINTSRGTASLRRTASKDIVGYDGKFTFTLRRDTVDKVTVRAFSVDRYEASFSTDLGLMPDQIPVTLFALITCSFVVDWFLNVSNYINALVPRAGVSNLASGYVVTRETVDTYTVTSCSIVPSFAATHEIVRPLTGAAVISWMHQTRVPGLVSPGLDVQPDFKFDKDVRVADAVALIYNKFGHLLKRLKI